jgi:hypothetical protein
MTLQRERTLIDFTAFGFDLLVLLSPSQGWQRPSSEPVQGGTAFWIGPVHGAVCRS